MMSLFEIMVQIIFQFGVTLLLLLRTVLTICLELVIITVQIFLVLSQTILTVCLIFGIIIAQIFLLLLQTVFTVILTLVIIFCKVLLHMLQTSTLICKVCCIYLYGILKRGLHSKNHPEKSKNNRRLKDKNLPSLVNFWFGTPPKYVFFGHEMTKNKKTLNDPFWLLQTTLSAVHTFREIFANFGRKNTLKLSMIISKCAFFGQSRPPDLINF